MANVYHVAFWNLENLFAPENFAGREPWIAAEMDKDLEGWSEALFNRKVAQLSSIIAQMNGAAGPDLLGVCEVENQFAIDALKSRLNAILPARNYGVVHVDSTRDRRGIDTAFIHDVNRLSVDPAAIFSHTVMRRTGTRDITQATFVTGEGNELVALANHWPSRSGGTYESRGFRMTAGETLAYWHRRIREEKGDDIPIIALGDFNDDPFDESVSFHATATRERGNVTRGRSVPWFYNLSWRYLSQQATDSKGKTRQIDGTLYFGGDGNVFDQILVSKGLLTRNGPLRVREETAQIEAFPEMIDTKVTPAPVRFGLPKGKPDKNVNTDGFSDHYPVSVLVDER